MKYTKKQKRFLSKMFNKGEAKPVPSLSEVSRTFWDEASETVIEFGFMKFDDESDDEIEWWLHETMWRYIPDWMYWDCTGCLFTWDISWKRNPNGLVSFVHRMSYDI